MDFCYTFEKTVKNYIDRQEMLLPGEHIVAGVSGGADSICLLELLHKYSKAEGWQVTAVHVHHGIRGEDADGDAQFVKEFCQQRGISCISRSYDVLYEAELSGEGEEEAGRRIRYQAFEEIRKEISADKIALAHHSDDQAETMLFHLIRGSSLKGLCGMQPVNGRKIRPFLCVRKEEICRYLQERGIGWRTDESNFSQKYTRNYLRQSVLPLLDTINGAAAVNISRAAQQLLEAETYLEEQTCAAAERLGLYGKDKSRMQGTIFLSKTDYEKEAPLIQKRVLYQVLCGLAGSRKDIQERHIQDIQELFIKQSGKRISLPYGFEAWRDTAGVWIGKKEEVFAEDREDGIEEKLFTEAEWFEHKEIIENNSHLLPLSGRKKLPGQGIILEWRLFFMEKNAIIPKNGYTKWIDYAKISSAALFRTRRAGDWFVSDSAGGHKKLKRYFIDEKIPKEQREKLLLLTDGSHVIWIEGGRISEEYKVREATQVVLELHFISEEKRQEAD